MQRSFQRPPLASGFHRTLVGFVSFAQAWHAPTVFFSVVDDLIYHGLNPDCRAGDSADGAACDPGDVVREFPLHCRVWNAPGASFIAGLALKTILRHNERVVIPDDFRTGEMRPGFPGALGRFSARSQCFLTAYEGS